MLPLWLVDDRQNGLFRMKTDATGLCRVMLELLYALFARLVSSTADVM